jgi:hypothetical protein
MATRPPTHSPADRGQLRRPYSSRFDNEEVTCVERALAIQLDSEPVVPSDRDSLHRYAGRLQPGFDLIWPGFTLIEYSRVDDSGSLCHGSNPCEAGCSPSRT